MWPENELLPNRERAKEIISKMPPGSLVDKNIREIGNLVIGNFDPKNVGSISYDLTAKSIISWELKSNLKDPNNISPEDINYVHQNMIKLPPGGVAFIIMEEMLNMPPNLIGRIMERTSIIRTGLLVSGQLSQPGYIGNIIVRVVNLSNCDIEIKSKQCIAQICFEALGNAPDIPYGKTPSSEFQYKTDFYIPKKYIKEAIRQPSSIEKKIDNLEARVYTVFTGFIGAFVSVLCLVAVNFQDFEYRGIRNLVIMNLSLCFVIVVILTTVLNFCFLFSGQTPPLAKLFKKIKLQKFFIKLKNYFKKSKENDKNSF